MAWGSIPGWGPKITQASQQGQNKFKNKKRKSPAVPLHRYISCFHLFMFFPWIVHAFIYWHFFKSNWRRQWHPTLVFLPGKSHGWRSLLGYSPWGHEESDMTERLHFPFSLSCIGEGIVTHSSVLAWRIPGTGSLVGCRLWGRTRLTWLSSSKFAFT